MFNLVTFADIIDAVAEELKLSTSDTVEMNRIRRDVNLTYINVVAPAKRWPWLRGNANIEHKPYYADGTVACTPDSTTITFSTAPATSKQGYLFSIDTFSEVYLISAHTAGQTTATLTTPFTGSLQTAATFKIWTDTVVLPVTARETVEVYHSFFRTPMKPLGLQDFRRRVTEGPFTQGRPEVYSTYDYVGEEDATRYRVMKVHPSLYTTSTTLSVDYVREIVALDLDDDEPVMPIEDRAVLVYGALERAWKRLRNTEAGEQSKRDFQEKLASMMGRVEDSQDQAQIAPASEYLARKRGRSLNKAVSTTGSGVGSYSAPSYLKNATIEGAVVTANFTVNSGITIDGRDVSADGATLDAHIAAATGAHAATAISVTPAGAVISTNVQNALLEISAAQVAASTASGVSVVPAGNLAANDVQEALEELQDDIDTLTSTTGTLTTGLSDHLSDAVDAHVATAIGNTPAGNLAATTVQAALDELQTDVDTRATSSALTTHTGASTGVHGVTGSVVGTSDTQVLTAKDIDGGTASNTSRLTVPKNTKTNLDALTRKEGTVVYGTDTAKAYVDNGTSLVPIGSGSGGGLNYISANSDAETDTTGYATYKDAAGALPVDGTGGSPTLTFTRSTSSPLRSTANFLITHAASDQQGEGASYAFTIDRADQGKQLSISFDYEVASGTMATGDLGIYIVDVTNSVVIQPSGYQVVNVSGQATHSSCVFQTASNSTSYRLCFHVATSTATAYTLKVDNVFCGPQVVPVGAAMSDWVSYTPTITGFGTPTNVAAWSRRVGDVLQVRGKFTSGTSTAVEARFSLGWNGVNGNVTSSSSMSTTEIAGYCAPSVVATTDFLVLREPSVSYFTFGQSNGTNIAQTKKTASSFLSSGDGIQFEASVPITGWSSNVISSDSAATRVVAMSANTTTTAASSSTPFAFSVTDQDTHGAYNSSTGVYTVKVPGNYFVSASTYVGASVVTTLIYINGVAKTQGTNNISNDAPAKVFDLFNLNAGDTIDIRPGGSATGTGGSALNRFSVHMIQGPAQIQAATVVAARYTSASGQSIPLNTSTIIDYATKVTDTTSSVTTGASWKFTAPGPGNYDVKASIWFAAFANANQMYMAIFKNGSVYSYGPSVLTTATSTNYSATVSDQVSMVTGDYVDIRIFQACGGPQTLSPTATFNYVSISRISGVN